jgi:hypothetical protein
LHGDPLHDLDMTKEGEGHFRRLLAGEEYHFHRVTKVAERGQKLQGAEDHFHRGKEPVEHCHMLEGGLVVGCSFGRGHATDTVEWRKEGGVRRGGALKVVELPVAHQTPLCCCTHCPLLEVVLLEGHRPYQQAVLPAFPLLNS